MRFMPNRIPVIATTTVYLITFCILLPLMCRDLVFSIYRSSHWDAEALRDQAMLTNRIAVKSATKYLDTKAHRNDAQQSDTADVDIAIVVVTVRRTDGVEPLGYLTRVVTELDRLSKQDFFFVKKYLLICNVEAGPGRHIEAEGLSAYFSFVERFSNGSFAAAILNPFEKEKQDYAFCIRQALLSTPRYILVVEDDAVPRIELFSALREIIDRTTVTTSAEIINKRSMTWSFLKLYYPERWQGFSFESRKILELFALFLLGGTAIVGAVTALCRRKINRWSLRQISALFSVGGLYLVGIVLSIGRQHLMELKRMLVSSSAYSLVPAPQCCTPCVLYTADAADYLVTYLETLRCSSSFPLDEAVDRVLNQQRNSGGEGETGYLVEPNLFRHVGFMSTIKGFSNHPEEFVL